MKPLARILFILLTSSFTLGLSGCNALGVAAYKLAGPAPVPAKYAPAKTPMLILIENRSQPSATVGPEVLTEYLIEDLSTNEIGPIIPSDKLQQLRDQKMSSFSSMSISSIGKAVGASQVLYVQFDGDDVTPLQGGEALQGSALVRVRMIDVATGQTLWPKDLSNGYSLSASTSLGVDSSRISEGDVHRKVYGSLAAQIGRLFHKWTPEDERPQE